MEKYQDQQSIKENQVAMKEYQHKEAEDQHNWQGSYDQESKDQIDLRQHHHQPLTFESDMFGSISQLDGIDDIDFKEEEKPIKSIFAVNCEIKQIIQIVNFLRSFNFLWISPEYHCLCSSDDGCSFCSIMS